MAEGDISAVIDTLEFDANEGFDSCIIHVSGPIYAIAYRDTSNLGIVFTVNVASDGQIGASAVDSLTFDATMCYYPDLIHVAGQVYAVAYQGESSHGTLKTFTIDASGNIGASPIDTLVFDAAQCSFPTMIHRYGDIYIICYKGTLNKGRVISVDIATNGDLGVAFVDDWYFDATRCWDPDIVHVSGNYFAIAYEGPDSDGWLCTVQVHTDGTVLTACTDTLEFDEVNCYMPSLLHITGEIYAIAYQAPNSKCNVVTFTITTAGQIGASTIDSFEFESVDGYSPKMVHISGEVYAVSYRGNLGDGWTVTFSIDSSGNISASVIDSLEFDTDNCNMPDMIHVSGNIYAIPYEGNGSTGWLKTIGIETVFPSTPKHELLMGIL